MSGAPLGPNPDEEARLAEIVDVVVAIASNDFTRRARVGDGRHLLDGLATGVNMLAEEVGKQVARDREFQQGLLRAERLAAVGQLAAGVAHEVNNPASFVLANLTLLERILNGVSPDDPAAVAEAIRQALELTRDNIGGVERIVAIARDLRVFARTEPHRLEPVAIADVIDHATKLVRAELAYRSRVTVHVPPGLMVRGDGAKLTQVLTNLLLNAAQAIPEGAAGRNDVRVDAQRRDGVIVVKVSDSGTGMTPDVAAHAFEPFFTTKARERGTGLGLTISADVVRQHGGELRLLETSPSGTTFELLLPEDAAPAATASSPARSAARGSTRAEPPRRLRLLIIDDEAMLLAAYSRLLGRDHDVTTAPGGREGVAVLERDDRWDAIVCDLMMPDMDGAAVFEWLRSHRPALVDRTFFCTGGAFTPRGFAFADLIGDRLLQKPILPQKLYEAITGERTSGPPT